MLGLGKSLSKTKNKTPLFNPLKISGCVAWYDFTDKNHMYTDNGTTRITGEGTELIQQIDNKAFYYNKNDTNALGRFLYQTTESDRPTYDPIGKRVSFLADKFLTCNTTSGNVATNTMSASTINGSRATIFFVIDSSASSVAADAQLLKITGESLEDNFQIYIDNGSSDDRWEFNCQDGGGRTHTKINCGQDITTNTELWTISLENSGSGKFYRNGDTSDGVTNGSTDNLDIPLNVNHVNVRVKMGNDSAGYHGAVYEFLFYNSILSNTEKTYVENYLKSKHRIT